jgi:glycosyltransferase involved in cell wall biosynthesis
MPQTFATGPPIRVLHLAPHEQSESGISTYAANFRRALTRAGAEIDALTPCPRAPNRISSIRSYRRRAVAESRQGYDLVHAELGASSLPEFYAALALSRRPDAVPVCLTLHSPPGGIWWPFHIERIREQRILRAALAVGLAGPAGMVDSLAIRSARHVFVFSETARTALRSTMGRHMPETSVIPFAMPDWAARPRPPDPRANGSPLVIGFFGYWYPSKNIEDLVSAIGKLRDEQPPVHARLWGIALPSGGRTSASYRDRVIRQIGRLGLQNRVELCGWVDDDAIADALASCDAIVLPYRIRGTIAGLAGTSAAARDALAAGAPVITTNTKVMSELIRHGENGLLFEPSDRQALEAHLRRLRDDSALRVRLRTGASQSATQLAATATGPVVVRKYAELIRRER